MTKKKYRIYESVKEMLKESLDVNNDFDVNDIDISQIPIDDLKKGYRDLRLTPTSVSYGDIFSDDLYIKEAKQPILD